MHASLIQVARKIAVRDLPKELRPPIPRPPELPIPTDDSSKEDFALYNKEVLSGGGVLAGGSTRIACNFVARLVSSLPIFL